MDPRKRTNIYPSTVVCVDMHDCFSLSYVNWNFRKAKLSVVQIFYNMVCVKKKSKKEKDTGVSNEINHTCISGKTGRVFLRLHSNYSICSLRYFNPS